MTVPWCAYCGKPATEDIPAVPGHVCVAHASEFWTGLLAYVRDQSVLWARQQKRATRLGKELNVLKT